MVNRPRVPYLAARFGFSACCRRLARASRSFPDGVEGSVTSGRLDEQKDCLGIPVVPRGQTHTTRRAEFFPADFAAASLEMKSERITSRARARASLDRGMGIQFLSRVLAGNPVEMNNGNGSPFFPSPGRDSLPVR